MWVPLVECGEHHSKGADYFVQKYLDELFAVDPKIDSLILGCTHYPLLIDSIRKFVPEKVQIITQGDLVAESLKDYLQRHPEMDERCSKNGVTQYLTTEASKKFEDMACVFSHGKISVSQVKL
jgi:glutamate racemase